MLFCQWCGKERDPDANALHYCGPKDRPAAYCIKCGQQLGEGAATCVSCGTPAGQAPAPVALAVSMPQVDDAGNAPAPGLTAPMPAPGVVRVAAAPPPSASRYEADTLHVGAVRMGQVWSSLAAVLAFFIPWTTGGQSTGISLVTTANWSWWNPVAPQLIFALLLMSLCLSFLARSSEGHMIDSILAVVGLVLVIFCIDWVYDLRQVVDYVTGFWVVIAGCLVLTGSASISIMSDRQL